jgi:hypothetical protein
MSFFASRGVGHLPYLLCLGFGLLCALGGEVSVHGAARRADGQHRAHGCDLPRPHQCLARGNFARALRGKLAFGFVLRFAFQPHVAVCADDTGQYVMRQLHSAHVEPLLDAQQPPVDERGQRIGRRAGGRQAFLHALLGQAFAMAGLGEQVVFDELTHTGGLVRQCAFVEFAEYVVARAGQQVGGNLRPALRDARVVELAADEAQQRGLDLGIGEFRAAGDETDDGAGHFLGHQLAARLQHGAQRLRAVHAG